MIAVKASSLLKNIKFMESVHKTLIELLSNKAALDVLII